LEVHTAWGIIIQDGARGRNRTGTVFLPRDFKSQRYK
jgi:hypothetical protein